MCESNHIWPAETPAWLTAGETQRLAGLSGGARDDFLASRWLIRRALAEASGSGAFDCRPVPGRPDRSEQPPGWRLSLSHSAGLAGCAVSGDAPIGLDLEPIARNPQWQKVVSRWFSPPETAWLLAANDSEAFLKVWTLKEAWLKATGRGIANNLKTLTITADFELSGDRPGEPWRACLGKSTKHWVAVVYQSRFVPRGFTIPGQIDPINPGMAAADARPVDWILQKEIHSCSEPHGLR
jgi:4'-phosphopantetheinyl transferase